MQSSSGGIFYALAEEVISKDGVVYGAAFDKAWNVEHRRIDKVKDLYTVLQSKYVQSATDKVFIYVAEDLNKGMQVLFCGTPCQIQGLLSCLDTMHVDRQNLITVDFICHGVPSPMVWQKYLEQRSGGKRISGINFRDKTNGWRDFSLKIDYEDGSQYQESWHTDPYVQGFIKNLYLRESCYECQFRGVDRTSDFTIADFWGVHELLPEMFDDKGTSVVMAHNDRAVAMLEEIQDKLMICEIGNDLVVKTNSPVVKSVPRNNNTKRFYGRNHRNIEKEIKADIQLSLTRRIKRKVKKLLSR